MNSLKLKDFTKYKFISGLRYSPDGKFLAFILHRMDVEENKYLSNIWLYNLKSNKYLRLTTFDSEKSFTWLNNDTILFPAIREEKDKKELEKGIPFTQYYKINIHGGEAKKAFRLPVYVSDIKVLDEKNFVFTALFDNNLPNFNSINHEKKEKSLKELEEEKNYEVLDEIPFWANGQGFINKKRNRLYLYNIEDKEIKPITDNFTNVDSFSINKEKTKILFIANTFKDKMEIRSDLYLYHIKEEKLEKLTHKVPFSYHFADFIEENIIFSGTDMKNYGLNENPHIFLMELKAKEVKQISPNDFDHSTWNSVGSDCRYGNSLSSIVDENYYYFVTTEGYNSYINRIDTNGNIEKVTTEKGSIDGFDIYKGKIIFVGLKNMKLQELYTIENNEEIQLTEFNEEIIKNKKLSKPEKIEVKTEDNVNIDGWIMKPVDFDQNKKYPGILNIHGGPKTVYGEVYFHEMQYWANEGYVVFFCNPRGSDGRGNEFSDIRGKYGTIDYDDLMAFTEFVLDENPYIDRKRLGVTGGSYGGFMTNWIIGHTNRFKAAASQRSISNWISKFATTDIGYFFVDDQQTATPWSNVDRLWSQSPLKYVNKATTPTLFIHSEEDYRCWFAEGIQMFTALKYHGVDARLCLFKGENHELSRSGKPKHRIRRLEEITNWFNKYLK